MYCVERNKNIFCSILVCLNVKNLLFANIKIFTTVSFIDDCRYIQSSLCGIEDWCHCNRIRLNSTKFHVISFHRSSRFITFEHMLSGMNLERVESIRELGVVFRQDLSPEDHIDAILSRAALLKYLDVCVF